MNYYVALLFKERPDLHMTLRYCKSLTPGKLGDLIKDVDDTLSYLDLYEWDVLLDMEDWFGPDGTVRVLRPTKAIWPKWVLSLVPKGWAPHVSTKEDDRLELTAYSVAIMQRKREIVRWPLKRTRRR